jgi:hypothetical protein
VVAAVVAVVALLFVIMKPTLRELVASSSPSDTTGSTPQSNQRGVVSKPALAELKVPVESTPSQSAPHEQSEELLQRFLQWREKANTTEAYK